MQFFFRGAGKSSGGGAAKGLPARAQQPGREHGRGRAATGPLLETGLTPEKELLTLYYTLSLFSKK